MYAARPAHPSAHARAAPLDSLAMSSSSVATQQDVSEEQSVALVRNLMRVTFSNVLYMRGIFEPDQFKPMNVGGITVQTIASESLHPNAKQVVEWMDNGVFDALKLGFLDKCVLVISADPEEKSTIEAWSACVSNHGIIDLHVG